MTRSVVIRDRNVTDMTRSLLCHRYGQECCYVTEKLMSVCCDSSSLAPAHSSGESWSADTRGDNGGEEEDYTHNL